jgi:ubiquinone/menaquinone biosynthesis C-methylase UbiE
MNCDRIAPLYAFAERLVFGRALERCRSAHLGGLGQHQAALVCGDGDGRFLRALVASEAARQIDYLDVSHRMTALAQQRLRHSPATSIVVEFACADVRTMASSRTYDLLATHFFLDCFGDNEIQTVVRTIARHATDDATWLVSEFEIPAKGLARPIGMLVVGGLYAAFRLLTGLRADRLPDYRTALADCGFSCASTVSSCGGLLTAQVWRRDGRSRRVD